MALRWFALSILVTALFVPGCKRAEQADGKRIRVALPQWFYPSEERPWLDEVWQTIREENPEWNFDLELVPGRTEQVVQRLRLVHASGQGPDLACVRLDAMPGLAGQGILKPIDDTLSAHMWQTMIPALLPAVEQEGKRYGVPYDIGVRLILYRTDLFEEEGIPAPSKAWTWDDLVAAAKRLTRDLNGDGTIDQWGFGVPAARSRKSVLQWLPWFWSLGGNLQGEDGEVALFTPAAVGAMQWYRDLTHRYRVTPTTAYSMDQDTLFLGMASGLFAITEGASWEIAMLRKHSPHHEKIRIALLPSPRPGSMSATLVDGWGFGLLSDDREKHKILARLLERLCSGEHQLAKYLGSGMLSPFEPLYQDPLFTRDPQGKVLAEALRTARPAPSFSSFPAVSEALEIALQEVLMNKADPATVLEARQAAMEAGFRRFRERRAPNGGAGTPEVTGHGERPAELSAQDPLPPQGSLLLTFAMEGEERLLSREQLLAMERRPVGDMELVPLAAFFPGAEAGDLVVRAADGFEKRVPSTRIQDAFLDPGSLYVYLVQEPGGRTFTVRDVTRITREARADLDGLEIVAGDDRLEVSASRLGEMAQDGTLPFNTLIEKTLKQLPEGRTVRLTARDGYSRDVKARDLPGGRLHLEDMKCEFPGLPSGDQVSGLVRIEVL